MCEQLVDGSMATDGHRAPDSISAGPMSCPVGTAVSGSRGVDSLPDGIPRERAAEVGRTLRARIGEADDAQCGSRRRTLEHDDK